ncbi:MAG: hypothetical protein OEN23_11895 [Paracoccaceae bacterium]|nr:hypothetical protein [Paracoccaceae bacterium]
MKILALWCHPRSMSTAFERVMRERGDLDVLHEPFMYHYYLAQPHRPFADFDPDPGHPRGYEAIRDMILAEAKDRPVFFKDMAYYVLDRLPADPGFMGAVTHAFLIRDPAASIVSYHRRDPGFACAEVGLEGQWRLYCALRDAGHSAQIIRADDVRADPAATMARYWSAVGLDDRPDALSWDTAVPRGWESVADWHRDTLQSGAIRPPETGPDPRAELAALGPPWTDYEAHHRPFYDALCAEARP